MRTRLFFHYSVDYTFPEDVQKEIISTIEGQSFSVSKGKVGDLKKSVWDRLTSQFQWSGPVMLDADSKISITGALCRSSRTYGICIQTGNMGRMYADLIKLQTIFCRKQIESAVFILPGSDLANKLGSNLANFDRLTRELPIFNLVITIPLLVVAIDM